MNNVKDFGAVGDGKGRRVELLPEAGEFHFRVEGMYPLFHAGEHLTGAHGHIVHGHIAFAAQISVRQQQIGHQIDDVPAGEVRSGFFAEGFREASDQIFKNVSAVHGTDLLRSQIPLVRVELLYGQIQRVAFNHAVDDVVKIELGQHILNIGGRTLQGNP